MNLSIVTRKQLPPLAEQTPAQVQKSARRDANGVWLASYWSGVLAMLGGATAKQVFEASAQPAMPDALALGVGAAIGGAFLVGAWRVGVRAMGRIKAATEFARGQGSEGEMEVLSARATRWLKAEGLVGFAVPFSLALVPEMFAPGMDLKSLWAADHRPLYVALAAASFALAGFGMAAERNLVSLRQLQQGAAASSSADKPTHLAA